VAKKIAIFKLATKHTPSPTEEHPKTSHMAYGAD
jgi:hypothetical protein